MEKKKKKNSSKIARIKINYHCKISKNYKKYDPDNLKFKKKKNIFILFFFIYINFFFFF
jgi:hypothetical protein